MVGDEKGKVKCTWGGARANAGGAREGAGRPKLEGKAVTKQVQFRLTEEQTLIVKDFVKRLKAGEIDIEAYQVRHKLKTPKK